MRKFQVSVNGNSYEVEVEEIGKGSSISSVTAPVAPTPVAPKAASAPVQAPSAQGSIKIVAPMPGKIVDVKVSVGQSVKQNDLVAVLEAMKMENEIFATASGTVTSVNVSAGSSVETNDVIITLN